MGSFQSNKRFVPIPASIFKRILAYLLDALILLVPTALMALLMVPALFIISIAGLPNLGDVIAHLLVSLPYILYFTILESSKGQASVGKKAFGLYVATEDGARISIGVALLRALAYALPGISFISPEDQASSSYFCSALQFLSILFSLGYLPAFFTKDKKTLYDIFTKTRVYARQK